MFRFSLLLTTALLMPSVLLAQEADTKNADSDTRAKLEKEFSEKLTGAKMTGTFTIVGKTDGKPPKPEQYIIQQARKVEGTEKQWVFVSQIQYANKKMSPAIPVPVNVEWAGDTPVITLTKLTIPGMGTFTARVLFYGDRYAGTWQHDAVGGHMWGTFEKK